MLKIILRITVGFCIGRLTAGLGYDVVSWQFWAIALPITCLTAVLVNKVYNKCG